MTNIARKTKRYPTDLADEEWSRIEPLLPKPPKRGSKVSADLREMSNAICYLARSGGGWRMLFARQSRVPRLRNVDLAPILQGLGLQCATATLGGRTYLWLDDALAQARARL